MEGRAQGFVWAGSIPQRIKDPRINAESQMCVKQSLLLQGQPHSRTSPPSGRGDLELAEEGLVACL